MKKAQLEELFGNALSALVCAEGGSLETALDDMGVSDQNTRDQIAKWFGWDD